MLCVWIYCVEVPLPSPSPPFGSTRSRALPHLRFPTQTPTRRIRWGEESPKEPRPALGLRLGRPSPTPQPVAGASQKPLGTPRRCGTSRCGDDFWNAMFFYFRIGIRHVNNNKIGAERDLCLWTTQIESQRYLGSSSRSGSFSPFLAFRGWKSAAAFTCCLPIMDLESGWILMNKVVFWFLFFFRIRCGFLTSHPNHQLRLFGLETEGLSAPAHGLPIPETISFAFDSNSFALLRRGL